MPDTGTILSYMPAVNLRRNCRCLLVQSSGKLNTDLLKDQDVAIAFRQRQARQEGNLVFKDVKSKAYMYDQAVHVGISMTSKTPWEVQIFDDESFIKASSVVCCQCR